MPTGLLLINLGTPDAPTAPAVRRYLRQFLGDPRVLDMNRVGRTLLLEGIILPFRPRRSAHAYQQIWDAERGSPLLFHGRDLARGVAERLGRGWVVELGMRYGRPSLAEAVDRLIAADVSRIVALPLFPQYASSSTGSALEELYRSCARRTNVPPLVVVPAFHDDPGFVDAFAAVAAPRLAELAPDHVILSFHGVPERHLRAGDPTGRHCLPAGAERYGACCDALGPANRNCYRAQCMATARALTARLGLDPARVTTAFQSRLGRVPWIRPYTDLVIADLVAGGVKKIAVLCPAFVADCLETLEEIGMRARDTVAAAGGELTLVPSLNASDRWIEAVADLARAAAPPPALPAGA
ncbi:MAG TPA: ferrochelatase [Kofleriaceae bacterium]|nr:ferrochelatase [Kofleriaceae bacterium]